MPPTPNSSPQKGNPQNQRLLLLLGGALLVFLVSLPWQMAQWKALEKTREETRRQEARVAELRGQNGTAPVSGTSPSDTDSRIASLQGEAPKGVTRSLLSELDSLKKLPLTPDQLASLSGVYQLFEYWDEAYPLARRAADEAKKAGAESPLVLIRLGYLEMLLGYRQSALPLFERAASLAPGDAAPQVATALAYDKASDAKSAEKALRAAVEREPRNVPAHLLLTQNLTGQGRYDEARKELDAAESLAPTDPQILLQRAGISFAAAKASPEGRDAGLKQASEEIEKCLQLDPQNPAAHFLKGNILQDQGKLSEARTEWEGLYQISPNYPRLRFLLGQLYVRTGAREKGNELIKAYQETDARDTEYNRLVTTLGMSPKDIAKRRDLARWCAKNGRLSRAILEWNQILAVQPGDAEAQREATRLRAGRDAQIRS